jgi:hypothetical protein
MDAVYVVVNQKTVTHVGLAKDFNFSKKKSKYEEKYHGECLLVTSWGHHLAECSHLRECLNCGKMSEFVPYLGYIPVTKSTVRRVKATFVT